MSGPTTAAESADTEPDPDIDARPSVFRNMAHMASSQVISWVLGTVAQIIQPRFLGPEGLGQLRLAFSIWAIAQVFVTLGTGAYLTLQMAKSRERGAQLVGPIFLIRFVAFVIASLAVAAYAFASGFGEEMLLLLAVSGSTMFFLSIVDVYNAALIGLERMSYPAAAAIISKTVYTIAMVAVLLAGGGPVGVALTTTLNTALAFLLLRHFYARFEAVRWGRPPQGYIGVVRASLGFLVASAVITVYLQIDTIVISWLVDEATLGLYATADVLASSLLFVPSIIMSTLFPVIGRLHESDNAAADDIVRRAFSVLMLAGIALGFGMVVVAEPFVVTLYGDDFRGAGTVLAVLGALLPLFFGTILLGTVAMATGRQRFWNTLMIAAIVLTIVLDLILVPLMDEVAGNGAIGGAFSYAGAEGMMVIIGIRVIAPHALSGETGIRVAKMLTAGGLMVVAAWPLRDQFLALPVVVGAAVYVSAVYLFGALSEDERELIRRIRARLGFRSASEHEHDGESAVTTTAPADADDARETQVELAEAAGPTVDSSDEQGAP